MRWRFFQWGYCHCGIHHAHLSRLSHVDVLRVITQSPWWWRHERPWVKNSVIHIVFSSLLLSNELQLEIYDIPIIYGWWKTCCNFKIRLPYQMPSKKPWNPLEKYFVKVKLTPDRIQVLISKMAAEREGLRETSRMLVLLSLQKVVKVALIALYGTSDRGRTSN